jgi:hypothetical protein
MSVLSSIREYLSEFDTVNQAYKIPCTKLVLSLFCPASKLGIRVIALKDAVNSCEDDDSRIYQRELDLATKHGIRLLFILDLEWKEKTKRLIWKSILKNAFGKSKTLYARKCSLDIVSKNITKEFLENNHIQGTTGSSISLGLFYEKELVALMTFGKARFTKNYDWELLRFCNKKGYTVVGGASKLLKAFKKEYSGTVVSYANRRFSSGMLYKQLGFTQVSTSDPNYWYFLEGKVLHNRIEFQKHKLVDKLRRFNKFQSESWNMFNNGYKKIYDCGNYVFVLNNSPVTKLEFKTYSISNRPRLISNAKTFVYVLLDPRKPGSFKYKLGTEELKFNYEPFYVGKGKAKRPLYHLSESLLEWDTTNNKYNRWKKAKIRKIHKETNTFIWAIADARSEENALKTEIAVIAAIGRKDLNKGPLINLTDGGEGSSGSKGNLGVKKSKEARRHMSEARKGVPLSNEHIKAIGDSVRARVKRDPVAYAEQARKGGQANRGKTLSDSHRENISKGLMGRKKSKSERRVLSKTVKQSNNYIFGILPPDKTKWRIVNSLQAYVKEYYPKLDCSSLSRLATNSNSYYKGFQVKRIPVKKKIHNNSFRGRELPIILARVENLPVLYKYI